MKTHLYCLCKTHVLTSSGVLHCSFGFQLPSHHFSLEDSVQYFLQVRSDSDEASHFFVSFIFEGLDFLDVGSQLTVFFFQYFDYVIHCLLATMVLNEKLVVNLIEIPCAGRVCFPLAAFISVSFSLAFQQFDYGVFGVDLFKMIYLEFIELPW